jgi:hypothetical protein
VDANNREQRLKTEYVGVVSQAYEAKAQTDFLGQVEPGIASVEAEIAGQMQQQEIEKGEEDGDEENKMNEYDRIFDEVLE